MSSRRFDPQDEFDEFEQDEFEQDDAEPRVERVRRQTGKTRKTGQNLERRQRDKEWGRVMFKFLKDRKRSDGKP
jgi:hypothetical protein